MLDINQLELRLSLDELEAVLGLLHKQDRLGTELTSVFHKIANTLTIALREGVSHQCQNKPSSL